jgi:FlaG/FlaF family flagellin (archaellin)
MSILRENAVSPVVGVMLMLVVTIIIAAVVSAFAGGLVQTHSKAPSATIQATFSDAQGMTITNAGGDAIPTASTLFTISNDPTFGQGLSAITTQVINPEIITDANGNQLAYADGSSNVTALTPGSTLYINTSMISPNILQPAVGPSDWSSSDASTTCGTVGCPTTGAPKNGVWSYDTVNGGQIPYWYLSFVNPSNVGKTFTLTLSDKISGGVIGKTTVTIAP